MTEHERDEEEVDLFEARKAAQAAEFATVQTDAAVAAVTRASENIQTLVGKNGYLQRFRGLFQEAS